MQRFEGRRKCLVTDAKSLVEPFSRNPVSGCLQKRGDRLDRFGHRYSHFDISANFLKSFRCGALQKLG